MHPAFKEFLIKDTEGYTPEQKQNFLRMLKFKPDQMVKIISDNIIDWGTIFCFTAGTFMTTNLPHDAQELLRAYQEHFAKDLEAITQ